MIQSESLPDFYSDPQIRHLTKVLEEVDRGQLLFPKFQRPYVWPKEMRIALLESILQGIPIGTIMIWRTRRPDVALKESLGPFLLPTPDEKNPVLQYILDGEQRLATLYFALFTPQPATRSEDVGDEGPEHFRIYFDLREGVLRTRSDLGEVEPHHLALTDVLHGPRLTRFQRNLAKVGTEAEAEALTEISDEVADAFRQYKLPIVPITSENLAVVTRTFERVNSQHVTMSEVHMVNALAWSSDLDLLDRFQAIKQDVLSAVDWAELDEQTMLRVCKVALDVPVYTEDADVLSNKLQQHPEVLDEVAEHLLDAAKFLRDPCGIWAPDLVPYAAQIVLLAAAFRDVRKPSAAALSRLRSWLWLTTYAEVFQRQMSDSRFSQLLEDVRTIVNGRPLQGPGAKPPARRRLTRFDFRHARSRAVALMLAQRRPLDPLSGTEVNGHALLAQYRVRGVPQLVTTSMVKGPWASSPGARVLVRPEAVGSLRKLLQSPRHPGEELLWSHLITTNAHEAFQRADYVTFVRLREDEIDRIEAERFDSILRRLYPLVRTQRGLPGALPRGALMGGSGQRIGVRPVRKPRASVSPEGSNVEPGGPGAKPAPRPRGWKPR